MPIELSYTDEPRRSRHRSHRRRSRKNRLRVQIAIAVCLGFAALGGLGLILVLSNTGGAVGRVPVGNSNYDNAFLTPRDPIGADKAGAPPEVLSAPAVSSGELPAEKAMVVLYNLGRIRANDNNDQLQLSYEFFKHAKSSNSYIIAVRMPGNAGITYASFGDRAPMKDTAILPVMLSRIGNHGEIQVWIESIVPSERVSNILTLK